MRYRKFGKLDWKASVLGFGCMRFPILDGDSGKIEKTEATRILRHAIDQGINYVDTAYPYHSGTSEVFVGEALKNGYREKVRLATKMPTWLIKTYEDFDRYLNEQLHRLQTGTIDFYLLHALNSKSWKNVYNLGVCDWAEKAIADGRIQHIGFSFHDQPDVFTKIIDDYDGWTFCQIQYNYMDIENQAGKKGLQYAAAKGLAVVIMEPLLGGRLAIAPEEIQSIWNKAPRRRSPADWALQWLWDQPEVSLVLSGMSTFQQVEENLISANSSAINSLTLQEKALVDDVRVKYLEKCPIPCTACEYCLPCPSELNIPGLFEMFNAGKMYDVLEKARQSYAKFVKEEHRADHCSQCRQCEEKCPQQIPISEWMVHVDEVLAQGKCYEDVLK